jgi:hypothetical protein
MLQELIVAFKWRKDKSLRLWDFLRLCSMIHTTLRQYRTILRLQLRPKLTTDPEQVYQSVCLGEPITSPRYDHLHFNDRSDVQAYWNEPRLLIAVVRLRDKSIFLDREFPWVVRWVLKHAPHQFEG